MPKFLKILFASFLLIFSFFLVQACKDKNEKEALKAKGEKATFYIDETIMPMMEEQVSVFQSQRDVTINLVPKAETEILKMAQNEESGLMVMSRVLSDSEQRAFTNKKIVPKITQIAIDGIALIVNSKANDTVIDLQNIIDFMQRKTVANIKGLVFDNPNSSTINYMKKLSSVKDVNNKNVFALKTSNEVIKYISENDGYIGVIGVNWMTQPMPDMQKFTSSVRVLGVKNVKSKPNSDVYYKPSQVNLSEGLYPLVRKIYMLNYEGNFGLGTSFVTFAAGATGQKIILKSGLGPVRLELREVKVRDNITTEKK